MAITARGGQAIDIQGRPLMVRDSRLASQTFGLGGSSFSAVPKSKFTYFVKFHRAVGNTTASWEQTLGLTVKNIDRPKINFDTEVLNQYNKKRIVQKRAEFQPVNIKLHDTIDNRALQMFNDYYAFYYGDRSNINDDEWFYDVTLDEFINPGQWGFTPPGGEPNQSYFFSKVEIIQFYNGVYDQFDLIHPKITSFDPDDLDYSNSESPNEIQLVLEYEGIIQRALGTALTDDLIRTMGLDTSGFYEAGDTAIVAPGLLKHMSPDIQDKVGDFIGGNSSRAGILNPLNRLITTVTNPLNILQSELPGRNEISFGNSLMNSVSGRLEFGAKTTEQLGTVATTVTNIANTGFRNNNVSSLAGSALRGLNALRGK